MGCERPASVVLAVTYARRHRVATLAVVIALLVLVGGFGSSAGARSSAAVSDPSPPVYLIDPGLDSLVTRPEYISFKQVGQTWTWIRSIRWRAWGGEVARGHGVFEKCSSGRCRRAVVDIRLTRQLPRDCPTGSSYTRITYVLAGRAKTVPADPYVCEND